MIEHKLEKLFTDYIQAFKCYDLEAVQFCYHLPCTLHTPDKIAYLGNTEVFNQEFNDIFTVLKHAKIEHIIATAASYFACDETSTDVCIDWAFIDNKDDVFAEFSAFYHLVDKKGQLKIVNVVSHDIENSVELSTQLKIIKTV